MNDRPDVEQPLSYDRREAMLALAKYAGAVTGSAAIIVTAEGLVSEASAYCPPKANGNGCGKSQKFKKPKKK